MVSIIFEPGVKSCYEKIGEGQGAMGKNKEGARGYRNRLKARGLFGL
jgi:hypothetical protein